MPIDISFITDRLACGSHVHGAAERETLRAAGITHVLSVVDTHEQAALYAGTGMHYLHNPVHDDGQPKPPEWFAASIGWALGALAQPRARVYVHCWMGHQRAPVTAYAILRAQGLSAEDAAGLLRLRRPIVWDVSKLTGVPPLQYQRHADEAIDALGYGKGAA